MKKLQRVKLINWHLFTNSTLDFSGNVLISGDNGSGKSTLVDAIHFVLSGGLARNKFNMASNNAVNRGRRSVETYMRARIGAVNQEFLRPESDIISHIALEFYDESRDHLFTLGTVLQISGGILLTPFRFYTLSEGFSDDLFFETNENGSRSIRNFDSLRKAAEEREIEFTALDSPTINGSYPLVRRVLDLPDEYEMLLSNAICFDPGADLLEFTNDFLLEKKDVSLDEVKKAAKAYSEIAQLLNKEEEKANFLAPLEELNKRRKSEERKKLVLDYSSLRLSLSKSEATKKECLDALVKLEESTKRNQKRKLEIQSELLSIENRRHAIESDSQLGELEKLRREREALLQQKEQLSLDYNSFDEAKEELLNGASNLGFSTSLGEAYRERDEESLRKALNSYQSTLSLRRNELRSRLEMKEKTQNSILEKLKELASLITTLESHQKAYPEKVRSFYALLTERFATDEDFAMNAFCDLVEVTDEAWRDVIEALLDKRRFDVFVGNVHFKEAARLLDAHQELAEGFGNGVVDSLSLEEGIFKVNNSLADKVKAMVASSNEELPSVRLYLDFLLGDIECVEEPAWDNINKWVTKDGLYFDGVTIRRLVTGDLVHYLGSDTISRRLEEARKRYDLLSEELSKLEDEIAPLAKKIDASKDLDVLSLRPVYRLWEEEESLNRDIEANEEAREALEHSLDASSLTSVSEALEELDESKAKLINEDGVLAQEKDELSLEKGRLSLQIETINGELATNQNALIAFLKEHNDPLIKEEAEEEEKKATTLDYAYAVQEKKNALIKSISDNERAMVKLMSQFNERFNSSDVEPVVENVEIYLERYRKIVSDSLVAGRAKAEEASRKAVENFKSSFLIGLRSNIQQANDLINKLNRVLKKHPFGADNSIYRFVIKPTADAELRKIYDIAVETNEDYFENDLFAQLLSPENRSTMDYLFSILANENPAESSAETIERFCDYRNYLSYDIVEVAEDGTEKRYSDNMRSRSGGETQTPFYVLIAASFDSAFELRKRSGASPCEIVMLDEAFNNMDSDRIEDMMEFYRALNIQLIVSVPTSRFNYLADHVDTSLILVNNNAHLTAYQGRKES